MKDIDEKLDENLIITQPDQPLGKQLVDRWDGKRFHTLKLFTGSTDKNGAFIKYKGAINYNCLPSFYHKADLFIFASTCENLPIFYWRQWPHKFRLRAQIGNRCQKF